MKSVKHLACHLVFLLVANAAMVSLLLTPRPGFAQFPGGILETGTDAVLRSRPSLSEILGFLPARGEFTFPAPYGTEGVRLTAPSDCGGGNCVDPVGYSYWRNINNHAGADTLLIFLGLNRSRGGGGPTLFEYNKLTGAVVNRGALFASNSSFSYATGEGWYFSATLPTKLYLNDGPRMRRYDVLSGQFETVFDASTQYGADKYIWQMHSSDDDRVHSATLRRSGTWEMLGCIVYREDTDQFSYYPKVGDFDECQIDKSGHWLVIKENVDGQYGEDNRIINVDTGDERLLLDQAGAAGHSDMGHGILVAADNWDNLPNAVKRWDLLTDPLSNSLVYHNLFWSPSAPAHVSHGNARDDRPAEQQYACGSSASRTDRPHANEVICFRLDDSNEVLVVAPVMTDLNAGGAADDYSKLPKGNLDVSGEYFIWTSNAGGNRLDAFLVKVPSHLLTDTVPADTTPPTISGVSAAVVTATGATILWTTSEPGDSQVDYGTSTAYGSASALDVSLVTAHSQTLSGLSPDTVYHYRVKSRDAAGNLALSNDFTFTTLAAPDLTPPSVAITVPLAGATVSGTLTVSANASDDRGVAGVRFRLDGADLGAEDLTAPYAVTWNTTTSANGAHVITATARDAAGNTATATVDVTVANDPDAPVISAVSASGVTATSATIQWSTNEASDSQVDYGLTAAYGSASALDTNLVTSHSRTLTGLAPATLYHFRVRSRDATGNLAQSGDFTFSTGADAGADALVGHWKLDEGAGSIAADASGNGYTANLLNQPGWTDGVFGKAVSLDGINDHLRAPHAAALNSYPLTVSVWVKTAATGLHGIVNKYAPGSFNGYQVFTDNGDLCAWYFRNAANHVWDGSGCTLRTPGYADDEWHHVVFVVDASGGRLYVDGVERASQAWTGVPGAPSTTRKVGFGWYPQVTQPYLPGTIDDVRIYARALSAAEVSALYSEAETGPEAVVWTDPVNVTVTGGSLQKTSGCDGCSDAGASSDQTIAAGEGYLEFTAIEVDKLRVAGLTSGSNTGTGMTEIDFAVRLQGGVAEVRESGSYRGDTSFASGDVFRIAVESGAVRYYKNGTLFHTSAVAPVYPLRPDASISALYGTVSSAMISSAP
jgi:hypothetical protein